MAIVIAKYRFALLVVSYAAVLCLVTQRSSPRTWGGALRDETKNGCVGDYITRTYENSLPSLRI